MTKIRGTVEPGFERVREAFEGNFETGGEVGAAFCLHVGGRPVVDLQGGIADRETGDPYAEDTLQLVFSTTKGATALCVGILADRGELDLDARVAEIWPEFAAEGKEGVTVAEMLGHRAGVPTVEAELTAEEVLAVDPIVRALAAQAPYWKPGSRHGYHALTYGWLAGEIVRRVSGKRLGEFFRDEVARPLGIDFWIGLPESEEPRVAPLVPAPPPTDPALIEQMMALFGPGSLGGRALTLNGLFQLAPGTEIPWNTRPLHASEIGAANGITNARSLSRMYAAAIGGVDGVRLFGPKTMERMRKEESVGPDACLLLETRFGVGFMLNHREIPLLGPGSFGHAGAGGSLGFADPESGVAFGYVMNQMGQSILIDPRAARLIDAVRDCL